MDKIIRYILYTIMLSQLARSEVVDTLSYYEKFNNAVISYNEGRVGVQDHYYISDPLPRSWGKQMIKNILNKRVEIGMKDRQVRISIGNPSYINSTSSRHGVGEQWIYLDQKGHKTYYQFEYGKLTFISD